MLWMSLLQLSMNRFKKQLKIGIQIEYVSSTDQTVYTHILYLMETTLDGVLA